jgi:hypothetical protein
MEKDIRKELKEMREEFDELQQRVADINTRHIPLHIRSKLIVIFSDSTSVDKLPLINLSMA